MNTEIRILLFPINEYDRRRDAELMENNVYNIHQLETAIPNDVDIVTLSDFMDLCNNQMLDLEQYWISYIRYNKEEI